MSRIRLSKDQIIINRKLTTMFIGIVTIILSFLSAKLVFGLLPLENEYTFSDILGLIYLLVWTLTLLCLGLFAFFTGSKKMIIDNEGVSCCTWFIRKSIKWDEIKDFGLSYCGLTRGEGSTYYLYFSKRCSPVKDECRKKLRGKMIKTFIFAGEYEDTVKDVISFCTLRTDIYPFIGKNKSHLF